MTKEELSKKELLNVNEAAQLLKVSIKTLHRWEESGCLVPQRTEGKHRRYTKQQIVDFIKSKSFGKKIKYSSFVCAKLSPVKSELSNISSNIQSGIDIISKATENAVLPQAVPAFSGPSTTSQPVDSRDNFVLKETISESQGEQYQISIRQMADKYPISNERKVSFKLPSLSNFGIVTLVALGVISNLKVIAQNLIRFSTKSLAGNSSRFIQFAILSYRKSSSNIYEIVVSVIEKARGNKKGKEIASPSTSAQDRNDEEISHEQAVKLFWGEALLRLRNLNIGNWSRGARSCFAGKLARGTRGTRGTRDTLGTFFDALSPPQRRVALGFVSLLLVVSVLTIITKTASPVFFAFNRGNTQNSTQNNAEILRGSASSVQRSSALGNTAVLAETTVKPNFIFNVNVPSLFKESGEFIKDLKVDGQLIIGGGISANGQDLDLGQGELTASNVLYSLEAGEGLSITSGQDPTISNNGVLSLGGSTGALTLKAGTGISISGLTITNSSPDTVQNTFKTIKNGSTSFSAGSATDTLEFVAGEGITLSSDTTNKKLTITGAATSGWTDGDAVVYLTTTSDNVGIGTSSPGEKLDVAGNILINNGGTIDTRAAGTFTLGGTTQTGLTLGRSGATTAINGSTISFGTNVLTFAGAETLTLTAGKNVYFEDDFSTDGAFPITLTSETDTNVTLPSTGTLLTNTASANQTITSSQNSGTVFGLTDTTAIGAAIKGLAITLSGSGNFDQTGLEFNLSGATGTNLNDIVGSSSTWKVSRAGLGTFANLQSNNYASVSASLAVGYSNVPGGFGNGVFSGNVGIGTSAPGSALDVASKFQVDSDGDLIKINNVTYSWPADDGGASQVLTTDGSGNLTWSTPAGGAGGVSGSGAAGRIAFWDGAGSITGDNGLWWDNTGKNVGIGTTAPTQKLDIAGNLKLSGYATASSSLNVGNFTTMLGGVGNAVFSGNVGIGTSSPSLFSLQVTGNVGPSADLQYDLGSSSNRWNNIYAGQIFAGDSGVQGYWQRNNNAVSLANITDDFLMGQTATDSAVVKLPGLTNNDAIFNLGTGNVGIGTTDPAYKLEVEGTLDATTITQGGTAVSLAGHTQAWSTITTTPTTLAGYGITDAQPLDSDLTTYAGITPSANVQTLLGSADFAAMRTSLSLVPGTNVQIHDADLTTYAGITPSSDMQSFLGAADDATARTNLGLGSIATQASDNVSITGGSISGTTAWNAAAIGTQYGGTGQNWSAVAQGSIPYFSGTGTMTVLAPSNAGYVLSTNGAGQNPSWIDSSGVGTNWWNKNLGVVSPKDITNDLLLGNAATDSAVVKLPGLTNNDAIFNLGTGNVGIGTTDPAYKLEVVGSANLSTGNAYYIAGTSVLNATTLGTNVVTSSLTTVGALNAGSITSGFGAIDTGDNNIITTGTMGSAGSTTFTGATQTLSATGTGLTLSGAGTSIAFSGAGLAQITTAANQHLALMPGGNVGIGTTAPAFALDINGDARVQGGELYITGIAESSSTTEGTVYYDTSDDNLYVYANGGWVDLTVQGGSGDITAVGSMVSGDAFAGSTADDDWLGLGEAAGRIAFDDQTTDYINILSGNLGVGTTAPSALLSVGATNQLTVDSSGNVVTSGTVNKLTLTQPASGSTLTIADGKTLTVSNSLTLAGTDSKTLNIGSNNLTFTTGADTNVTLPTTGTLITNTATAQQTITSSQNSGTVFKVTDTTEIAEAIIGMDITLSGTGNYDQTGLKFNLSNASGTNLNDVVGSGSTWKISRTGVATFDSLTITGLAGTVGWVQRAEGAVSPTNITDDLLMGATGTTGTSSATVRLPGLTNQHAFFNLGTGNLGIGTTSPTSKLDVRGNIQSLTTDPSIVFNTSTATDTDFWAGVVEDAGGDDDDFFVIGDGTTPGSNMHLAIGTSGNVGIGTTAVGAYNLNVNGTVNATAFYDDGVLIEASPWVTNGSDIGYSAGNVGVGTTAPSGKFGIVDTSNTAASFSLTNNTATTIGVGANTLGVLDLQSTSLTTGNFMNIELNALTSGKGINLTSTSTAFSSGSLMNLDWSPGSATTATGDLLTLNVGANGNLGYLLNIKDSSSSIFTVSETEFATSLPTEFTSAGDLSIAYDLVFDNPDVSYIKSAAPLVVQAGEVFNSTDLFLSTFNKGNVIVDAEAFVTNYAATVSGKLTVGTTTVDPTTTGNLYVTNSSTFGKALAILNQTESQDIFTASASGTTRFVIQSGGNVGVGTATPSATFQVGNQGDTSTTKANAWSTFSDARFKDNINTISNSLDKVMLLNGVSFNWKTSGLPSIGFVAQDAERVVPEIVSTDAEGFKSMDYSKITPLLVNAIHEQQNQIAELRGTILGTTQNLSSSSALLQNILGISTSSGTLTAINLDAEMATISADLTVLGRTTLNDLGVTGNITAGVISINGLDGEINTIGGPLKLQPLAVEGIEMLGGKVTIDTNGNIKLEGTLTAKSVETEEVKVLGAKTIGNSIMPSGKVSVVIKNTQVKENSRIFLTPKGKIGKQSLVIEKIDPGVSFTVSMDYNLPKDLEFDWWIVN